ncbi:hypothetical protein JB92DRAFT_2917052 [Gautieria morchelliformis]|nr:hypothetical protein JB92DRAFT_2917052 [Gautieria morchelliformis]
MGPLIVCRSALLAILVASSLIVLGINASFLNLAAFHHYNDDDADDDDNNWPPRMLAFEATGVAVAVLTLLTAIPVLIMNLFSRRSINSLVEIGCVAILMILWALVAGQTSGTSIPDDACSPADHDYELVSFCIQFQAIQAFSWLNSIILLSWLITMVIVVVVAHIRGGRPPLSDATVPSMPSPPPPYVEPSNTVLMTQHPGREMLLGQFVLASTHVSTSSSLLSSPAPSRNLESYAARP